MRGAVKEGLYVCEAVNGVGSARTQCCVTKKRIDTTSIDTTIQLASETASAKTTFHESTLTKYRSIVDLKSSAEHIVDAARYCDAGTVNFVIDAEAQTVSVQNYKTAAQLSPHVMHGRRLREESIFKVIIEEDVIRTRYYLRVVERSAREFWTHSGRTIERVPHWSREITHERVEYRRDYPYEDIREYLEDKSIIERYVKLLQHRDTGGITEEQETRFSLKHSDNNALIEETRELWMTEEYPLKPIEDAWSSVTIYCSAPELRANVDAYVLTVTRYRYIAAVDVSEATRAVTGEERYFEASTEDITRKKKVFRHINLWAPQFVHPFSLYKDDYTCGLKCAVAGRPSPFIRVLHNGRAILRDNQ